MAVRGHQLRQPPAVAGTRPRPGQLPLARGEQSTKLRLEVDAMTTSMRVREERVEYEVSES